MLYSIMKKFNVPNISNVYRLNRSNDNVVYAVDARVMEMDKNFFGWTPYTMWCVESFGKSQYEKRWWCKLTEASTMTYYFKRQAEANWFVLRWS